MMRFLCGLIMLLFFTVGAYALPPIERVETKSGIRFWLVEDRTLPLVTLYARWQGGAVSDPENLGGLSFLTAGLLNEASGEYDSWTFRKHLARTAAEIGFTASRDVVDLRFRTLTHKQKHAFNLLRTALTAPRFDEDDIDRAKAESESLIDNARQNQRRRASGLFMQTAFPEHPYGQSIYGTREDIAAITREDIMAHYKRHFARDNMTIAIAGAISAKEAAKYIDDIFGTLPAHHNLPPIAPVQMHEELQEVFEARNGPQSTVMFGHNGYAYEHPQFFAAYVLNYILGGGGFSARFMEEIREKRGLVYGVSSYLVPLKYSALWLGHFSSSNDTAGEAMDIIRHEMFRIADEGVSAKELADAKTYLTGSYPLGFDSTEKIAEQLLSAQWRGLSPDYFDKRNDYIRAVTRDDIQAVARDMLKPGGLLIVTIGGQKLLPF